MGESGTFARWLRSELRRREWSQADFSERSGFASSSISQWLTGKRLPDPASCDGIADALGLPVDTVLTIAGHRPRIDPLPPDDPRVRLKGLVDRVQWTEERIWSIEGQLHMMLDVDRKRAGQS